LYWLRQKVCVRVLALKEQNRWLMMVQTTSSDCIAEQRCGGAGLALLVLRALLLLVASTRGRVFFLFCFRLSFTSFLRPERLMSLVRVVIICPASTHTALVSSPSLAVLHLPT